MRRPVYTCGIIGAGGIAVGYDSPHDRLFLTHAHALTRNKRILCVGVFDVDSKAAKRAEIKWKIPAIETFGCLLEKKPDIIFVCVPDEKHYDVLLKVLEYRPKLVVCEKPLTTSVVLSNKIIKAYRDACVTLAVNYQRRYDSTIIRLKRQIQENKTGQLLTASLIYSKGILHNGSHGIDIFRYLLGEVRRLVVLRKTIDFVRSDPTVDGVLVFENGTVHLMGGNENSFSVFEVDMLFERVRMRLTEGGMNYQCFRPKQDQFYRGFKSLSGAENGKTSLGMALWEMVNGLIAHLDNGLPLRISAEEALKTQQVCELLAKVPIFSQKSKEEGY